MSVLVRTHRRTEWLRQALRTVANQTYPNIEVVVVEDGLPEARDAIEREFEHCLSLRYHATGERLGRARAGNLALGIAKGEWLLFLDDDDVLFADHVEVLVDEAQRRGLLGVYALAWETPTRLLTPQPLRYEEVGSFTRYREEFDRLALWHHDFLPIQSVLFHRSLYERYGGFDESMDQLEDWNLWTRYTLRHDFALVHKTTSKYRVPADKEAAAARQRALDAAYGDAIARHEAMIFEADPRLIMSWVKRHLELQPPPPSAYLTLRRWAQRHMITRILIDILRPAVLARRKRRAERCAPLPDRKPETEAGLRNE